MKKARIGLGITLLGGIVAFISICGSHTPKYPLPFKSLPELTFKRKSPIHLNMPTTDSIFEKNEEDMLVYNWYQNLETYILFITINNYRIHYAHTKSPTTPFLKLQREHSLFSRRNQANPIIIIQILQCRLFSRSEIILHKANRNFKNSFKACLIQWSNFIYSRNNREIPE